MCLVIHPVLCDKCVELLRIVYKFKSQCLKIEENILRFAQAAGQSKVNLSEYCKRKITCIEPKKNSRGMVMEFENLFKNSLLSHLHIPDLIITNIMCPFDTSI